MKTLIFIAIFATSCVSKTIDQSAAIECIEKQTELYGDLCAEGRSCEAINHRNGATEYDDPEFDGCYDTPDKSVVIEAHYEGVECAARNIRACLELPDAE